MLWQRIDILGKCEENEKCVCRNGGGLNLLMRLCEAWPGSRHMQPLQFYFYTSVCSTRTHILSIFAISISSAVRSFTPSAASFPWFRVHWQSPVVAREDSDKQRTLLKITKWEVFLVEACLLCQESKVEAVQIVGVASVCSIKFTWNQNWLYTSS